MPGFHMVRDRKRVVSAAAVGALALVVLGILVWVREPRYAGRSLTSWIEQYTSASFQETNQIAEARNAIRAIGPEKSLPVLMRLVSAKDNAFDRWAFEMSQRFNLDSLHLRSADEWRQEGVAGFEVLGTNAAPAVGALMRLLDDRENGFTVIECLGHIGKPAEEALCQCLTNSEPIVREGAISLLATVTDDLEVFFARIKGCLNDPDSRVQVAAVQAIGAQEDAPDLAMPLLIGALNSSDVNVSIEAAREIRGFGTNGASAFMALTNLVARGEYLQTQPALQALAAIAPVETVPVLSNIVVNGTDFTGAALSGLKPIAPELCLQMTLAELHSPDGERRLRALGAASSFEIETPGIAAALRLAIEDHDPRLSNRAKMVVRTMQSKSRENGRVVVRFAEDPSYAGKSLSEWLQMRREWELETNAVEALRQMGTNVIPALVHRIEYRDPVFGLDDFDVTMEGVSALIALKEHAKPALPRLSELMENGDESLAAYAMMATVGTGRDAIPFLMKGLTNRFPNVRDQAANILGLPRFGGHSVMVNVKEPSDERIQDRTSL